MTIIVPRTARSFPLIEVRNILRAWSDGRSRDPKVIASRKDVSSDHQTVKRVLAALREKQFIGMVKQERGDPIDALTDKGLALAQARVGRRLSKSEGYRVLDRLLSSCHEINTRNDVPFSVAVVWLFGSMIDRSKSDVGDIDIVIETERRHELPVYMELQTALATELNCPARISPDPEKWVRDRLLYGKRRHPALAPNDLSDLKKLASPCQLIFDRRRGRVTGEILSKHPCAGERSATIRHKYTLAEIETEILALHELWQS